MNIPINKDINEEYKSDLWKGFTGRQLLFISIALCCGTGMILLCYGVIHIPITYAVYLGMPVCIPIIMAGFWHFQGLTFCEFLKVRREVKKNSLYTYQSTENHYDFPSGLYVNNKKSRREKKDGTIWKGLFSGSKKNDRTGL